MRSATPKFKLVRHFTAAAWMALLMAGCAVSPVRQPPTVAAPPQPLSRLVVPLPDADHDLLAQLLAAEMALTRTDLKGASGYYGKAMRLSSDPRVAERAAQLAIAVHDDDSAALALDRWQALGGKPGAMAEARAELALNRGDADEARKQLEWLTGSNEKDAWRLFGRVLLGARDQAQAARLLETLATPARLPADPQAWFAMSEMGDKFGRPAYAWQIAEAAMKRFGSAESMAWAAQVRFKSGDADGARKLLREAAAKAPENIQLRIAYAHLLGDSGDFAGATRVLERGPQSAETFAMRVGVAVQSKNDKLLDSLYQQLRKASPEIRQRSAYLLGQLAERQGQTNEALAWYSQVGDDDASAFDAELRSAVLLQVQGKGLQAHRRLEQMQLDYLEQPEQLRRSYQLDAEIYLREGNYAKAEAAFSRALQVVPDDPELLYGRGLVYAEDNKIDLAVADFRRLLSIRPDDVDASNALGYTLADANRDLAEAERLIGLARNAKPDDPAIADSWGWLQYRLGNLDIAAKTLQGAWQANKDAEIGVHLGEVLWQQGRRDEAQKVFDEVRQRDPQNSALQATLKRLHP